MAEIKVESESSHGLPKGKYVFLATKTRSARKASMKIRRRRPKRRGTPASYALHKVRKAQESLRSKSPKGAFYRVVRDIAEEISPGIHFQASAFAVLQVEAEAFLTTYFKTLGVIANHVDRVTVKIEDSAVARHILGIICPSHALAKKKLS